MDIFFKTARRASAALTAAVDEDRRSDCLLLPLFGGFALPDALSELMPGVLAAVPWLEISPAWRDFKYRQGDTALLYGHPEQTFPRVLLVGLGEKAPRAEREAAPSWNAAWPASQAAAPGKARLLKALREGMAAAMALCRAQDYESLALPLEAVSLLVGALPAEYGLTRDALLEEAVFGALAAAYAFDGYHRLKSEEERARREERLKAPRALNILCQEEYAPDDERRAVRRAEAVAAGVFLARDLVNGPANLITPDRVADEAQKVASRHGFAYSCLDGDALRELGMGAFIAVAEGSVNPPCLVLLEHCPKGAEDERPLVFVGKGLTFDSGGLSLKPPAAMWEMKSDMAGAAAVLGFFAALGASPSDEPLRRRRIVGLLACAENMPDARATRPGDVVVTLSGKTVEIQNTDAEGRLVLCDAMTLAQERWRPELLVDIATLTGACMVALGEKASGVFSTDPGLAVWLNANGERTGERFWPLPLWDDEIERLKSDVADLANVGPREGGALWAALFLKQFVEREATAAWMHLDIAAPAYLTKPSLLHPGGATGLGVRSLYEIARLFAARGGRKERGDEGADGDGAETC